VGDGKASEMIKVTTLPGAVAMNLRATLALSVVVLSVICFAQEPKNAEQPGRVRSEIQTRAEALFDRARLLSDIRAEKSPPFRLQATFSLTRKNLETSHGTYTEIWISDSQFRRETVINDMQRLEVGTAKSVWQLDSSKNFPLIADRLPSVINVFPERMDIEFGSVQKSAAQEGAQTGECAVAEPHGGRGKRAFCFEEKSGVLWEALVGQDLYGSDYACFYGEFRKFGSRWFPRQMACFDGSVKRIEAEVTELVTAPSADASLFTPPTGAAELGRCFSKIEFPARAFTPEPDFPRGELQFGKGSSVELSLIVDKQGKSQDVRINESGGKQFDEVALKTVRQWRFKPATCDGEPMAQKIGVNVGFHLR